MNVEYAAGKAGRNGQSDVRTRAVNGARSGSLGEDGTRRSFGTAGDHDDWWIDEASERGSFGRRTRHFRCADRKGRAEAARAALALRCRIGIGICVCIGVRSSGVRRCVIMMAVMLMPRRCPGVRTMVTQRATGLHRCSEALEGDRQHQ